MDKFRIKILEMEKKNTLEMGVLRHHIYDEFKTAKEVKTFPESLPI